jgi:hypothetical protein
MAIQTVLEKLQYNNEKNILIQGLPSSVEKQFMKISFSKSVTPLLRVKKVDFALVFAVSQKQLNDIITEIMPALHVNTKLWVAHPKPTAKIASDLCRVLHWQVVEDFQLEAIDQIEMDNVWCATNFKIEGENHSISNSVPRYKLAGAEMEMV